jgi:hypothetical protein
MKAGSVTGRSSSRLPPYGRHHRPVRKGPPKSWATMAPYLQAPVCGIASYSASAGQGPFGTAER